jgi:hypothetical protein
MYFTLIPFSDWCILLLAKETDLTQGVSVFCTLQNVLRQMVCAGIKENSLVFIQSSWI